MNALTSSPDNATSTLGRSITTGFKFLAWLNGLGVLLMLFCSMGAIELGLVAAWYRFPLALFRGGLALGALGLLWSYTLQSTLIVQMINGQARRTHWIPLSCTLLAYILSLAAFACGCWFFQLLLEALD
jgi:hypothetical protein